MYWHIDTDFVGLLVMCALYYYTVHMLRDDEYTAQNKSFVWCLRGGIIMTMIDIAASVIMDVPTSRVLYHLLMTLYLLSQDWMIVMWILYALTILYKDSDTGRKHIAIGACSLYALYALLVLTNPWTALFFSLGPNMEYARGPLFLPCLLGLYYVYAIALIVLTIMRRKHIPAGYPKIVLVMQPLILTVAIPVQLLNDGWLMIFPAYMLCLLLAFLYFQNLRVRTERAQLHQLTDMVEHFVCGMAIFSITDGRMCAQYVSTSLADICETDTATLLARFREDMLTGAHPDDRARLEASLRSATSEQHDAQDLTYRYITDSGKQKWITVRARAAVDKNGAVTIYATYTDLTEQKKAEQQLADVIQTIPCGICFYHYYDNDLHPVIANQQFSEMLGEDAFEYLKNVKGLQYTHVHPDDLEYLRTAAYRALTNTHEIDVTYRSHNDTLGEYIWVRMRGRMRPQPDGSLSVYMSYYDVTQEHLAEQQLRENERELWAKYELEKKRIAMSEENLIVHAVFNLTTGQPVEYRMKGDMQAPPEMQAAFSYGQNCAGLIIDKEERARFIALNDRDTLLGYFADGSSEFRLEYRRTMPDGQITWVRDAMHLLRDPRSNDVLLFEYWYDIETEKMLELMYRSIATDNYDFVARIDGISKRFDVIAKTGLTFHMPPPRGENADAVTRALYNEYVLPEDREAAIENSLVENIKQHLQARGRYTFTYRIQCPDGSIQNKVVTQYYIDPQREIIAMMREDVTELIRGETEKNRMLADALETANQASRAKSQFLSRVSHELRTPLNAIIGFLELAKDADAEQIESYLVNSDIAAKQLLVIINDVLDVSSIESGKLMIAYTPFDFKRLIYDTSDLFIPQCRQKNVTFDTVLLTPVDDWLRGDQLRVKQILYNLLSNAIKFTAQGRIWLRISQRSTQQDKVIVRFEVSDTGCGMSAEMQERLFKPFEQENAITAQKYGGNGLGLFIVSSLVSMMDGVIRVQSVPGEGSTFTVDLPFTKSEPVAEPQDIEDLESLHVLAVNDNESECAYTAAVLERINVRHTCVEDEAAAFAELARAADARDEYNICLLDWETADASGLEIARRIRERYGKRMLIVVTSAYEHYRAEESAKAEGADAFIEKRQLQSALFDLFSNLTEGRAARKKSAPARLDFSGKRILLAEDNAMNRIVAKTLICKKFGAECDCADDGKIALDMFLASPVDYYDIILMDIQMPNMDGFEATKRIRDSGRPDASAVQIMAFTANAFNEDIEKSLANGMNAHVAKPVEPDLLGVALSDALQARRKA
ncbi:MAG: PAS domain-containing protein [Eubacteriales bacterium]|nr:PAS domain-containing protein [Eubacteriales bacterium]